MLKLLLILAAGGALASGLAEKPEPPLLIDSHPAATRTAALDAAD